MKSRRAARTEPSPVRDPSAPGRLFADGELLGDAYRILSLLGEGSMGEVYEAEDVVLGRRVAIKAARQDAPPALLRREARALAALRHPSFPMVLAFGRAGSQDYLVMELVQGLTLEQHMAHRQTAGTVFDVGEACAILSSIAAGIAAVHAAGIAHRDVKPANIMIAPGPRVLLMDFGLMLPEVHVSTLDFIGGTPAYMAPEATANTLREGDARLVDIYSLGVLAFELFTGALPFEGEADALSHAHAEHAPPEILGIRPDLPKHVGELIMSMLAKDPEDRPSADAVARQLGVAPPGGSPDGEAERPLSVLIADDDAAIAKMFRTMVTSFSPGAVVRIEGSGDDAISALTRHVPDLVLLDMNMPGTNGIEVAMFLAGSARHADTVVVSVSAAAVESDRAVLRSLGVNQFVDKGPPMLRAIERIVKETSKNRRRAPG